MKKISILILGLFLLGLAACTIEKRHFMKGYHVEWKQKAPEIGGDGKTTLQENTASVEESMESDAKVNAGATSAARMERIIKGQDFMTEFECVMTVTPFIEAVLPSS